MGFSHENDNSLADALWLKNNFVFHPQTLCDAKTILHFVRRHSVTQKQFCISSAGTLWLKNNFVFRPLAPADKNRRDKNHKKPSELKNELLRS